MVKEMLMQVWSRIKAMKPAFISKKPHFNFITIHYFWIIGLTILGSIFLYPAGGPPGGLAYIDALFFSSGACTQSGLNTVDVNLLNTYQQIVLFFLPMLTNPITINTFVVFLRLYWFEKRFQHIAMEAKKARKSFGKSFSKSKSQAVDDDAVDREERGVGGRAITVMHDTTKANGNGAQPVSIDGVLTEKASEANGNHEEHGVSTTSGESSQTSRSASVEERDARHRSLGLESGPTHNTIKFADEVKRSDGYESIRMPQLRSTEEHLAVLKRQREDDQVALRIPGPREQDQGMTPQQIEDDELSRGLRRRASTFGESEADANTNDDIRGNGDHSPPQVKRGITIHEPTKPKDSEEHEGVEDVVAMKHVFSPLKLRLPRVFTKENEDNLHKPKRTNTFASIKRSLTREKEEDIMPYLSWEPTVGRNSAFVDLDERQREELGGIEYRSLKSLALVLVIYFWGFTIFGWISLLPWIRGVDTYGAVVTADGQSRTWWGFFTGTSAFNDVGFTLTPDSMISFQNAIWPLLCMSFLIIIGNTGFPIMLRFIIWVTTKYVPKGSGIWEELKFLLDHPRRCFTLLFPSSATWWLFWILVILNGVDLLFFIILDFGNEVVEDLPVNIRVLAGWFQAVSTRTAGFAVVNLANLHPAIQVSYMLMMYISVLPIAISVRRTNVYEEKSLGIWGSAEQEGEDEAEPSYVGAHLRRQLSFDLWYIFLGFFIISISEGSRLQSNTGNDQAFTMFAVLFEVVSAYGTVGLSLGYPTINASFSAEFGVIAKLVIIAMQIRGRHRGLPYELDRAILLPSESLHAKENDDKVNALRGIRRRNSSIAPSGAGTALEHVVSGGTGQTGRSDITAQRVVTNRSKRMSVERGTNLLSSLLHPGPMNPHRNRSMSRGRRMSGVEEEGDFRGRLPHSMTGGIGDHTSEYEARVSREENESPHAKRRSTAPIS